MSLLSIDFIFFFYNFSVLCFLYFEFSTTGLCLWFKVWMLFDICLWRLKNKLTIIYPFVWKILYMTICWNEIKPFFMWFTKKMYKPDIFIHSCFQLRIVFRVQAVHTEVLLMNDYWLQISMINSKPMISKEN